MIAVYAQMLLIILACSTSSSDTSLICDEAQEVEWDYWADGFFRTYCKGCHSSTSDNRFGAPERINFDSQDDVIYHADLIYNSVIINQNMPKGGGVEEVELQFLETYLRCWGNLKP